MLWKFFNTKILKKENILDDIDNLISVPIPIRDFYEKNCSLLEKVKQEDTYERKGFYLSVMDELLRCQTRFITSIYLNLFLLQDHEDEQLDAKVFNFLTGTYSSHNEMIELCENLCRAMFDYRDNDCYEILKDKKILVMYFGDVRLPILPLLSPTDGHLKGKYEEYATKLIQVNDILVNKKMSFLLGENVCLHISLHDEQIANELDIYKENVEKYLVGEEDSVFSDYVIEKYINESGRCWLDIPGIDKIRLDPLLIPLKNSFRKLRLASLKNMSSMSNEVKCRLEYIELFGDGKIFSTNNKRLFRDVFFKKGNVLESPVFPYNYTTKLKDGSEIVIKLYDGDILNLNFLKGIRENDNPRKKAALVNIIYKDGEKTELADALETIAEISIDDITKGKLLIKDKNVISSNKVGNLNFHRIYHCPVYDRQSNNQDDKNIRNTIDEILSTCLKDDIEILIVPSFGSFQAGQDRSKVAIKWHEAISNFQKNSFLRFKDKEVSVKQIIFGFINKQAMNVYHRILMEKTTEPYNKYHYPVAKLAYDIHNITEDENRFGVNLDLVEYIYQFFTAMAIRSISRDIYLSTINKNEYFLSEEKKNFLNHLWKITGLRKAITGWSPDGPRDAMIFSGTRMTPGKWQLLCKLGALSIGGDAWGYERFFEEWGNNSINVFLHTINDSQPATVRNLIAHSNRNLKSNVPYDDYLEKVERQNQLFLQQTCFFDQQSLSLIVVKSFEIDEDRLSCRLEYFDLKGVSVMNYPKIKKVVFKFDEYYKGPYFESGKVFLVKNLPENGGLVDGYLESLNMFPFLIYGKCPVCAHENGFFVWYDFVDREDRTVILYRPLICTCDLDNVHHIGDFLLTDIMENINGIFSKINCADVDEEVECGT